MNAFTIDPEGWAAAGEAQLPEAIKLRRAIHAEPELGLELWLSVRLDQEVTKGG